VLCKSLNYMCLSRNFEQFWDCGMYRKKCHIGKVKIVDFDIYSIHISYRLGVCNL